VDDPATTLTATTKGIRGAVEAARHLAGTRRDPEAWSVLAGYTSCLGDRITSIQLETGPIARTRRAHARHIRPRAPCGHACDTLGDALSL
jgi:hypothetical protein